MYAEFFCTRCGGKTRLIRSAFQNDREWELDVRRVRRCPCTNSIIVPDEQWKEMYYAPAKPREN